MKFPPIVFLQMDFFQVEALKLSGEIHAIGDGFTDYQLKSNIHLHALMYLQKTFVVRMGATSRTLFYLILVNMLKLSSIRQIFNLQISLNCITI